MKSELKPCPFCGGEGAMTNLAPRKMGVLCSNVDCPVFDDSYFYFNEEEATQAWNTRATPDLTSPEMVEKVVEALSALWVEGEEVTMEQSAKAALQAVKEGV